jgi:hypothetical protein
MCGPKIKISEANYLKIKEICASFNNNPGELINVLHKTQEHFGYLPEEVQQVVADCLGIPVGKVFGVVSFYSLKANTLSPSALELPVMLKVLRKYSMLSRVNSRFLKAA